MTGQRHLGLVAAAATLLAAAPLSAIFAQWTWLVQCVIAVALIAAAAGAARSLRAPVWAQAFAMLGALLLALTWMFPSNEEFLAVLPSPDTFARFGELTAAAGQEMRNYGVPVPNRDALLFITVLGVGGVAILVDVLSVGLRRPALAGLPMLAIYSVPVAVYVDSVPAVPFIVGAVGFLWLLVADNVERVRRFGRRFTGDGRDVDAWEPSPLAAAGRRLTVVGVAAAVLLPVVVPGMTGGLLARITQTGVGTGPGTGLGSGRVSLFAALSGQLNQAEVTEMVRVTTNEPEPFYLRYGVADVVDQSGFSNRGPTGRSVGGELPDPRDDRPQLAFKQYRASVEVTNFDMPMVPTYATTVRIEDLDRNWAYDSNMQVVYSNRARSKGKRYDFEYVVPTLTPAALRRADPLPDGNALRTQFTAVPDVREVNERVSALVAGKRTEYDKVRSIYDFFSRDNGFTYSLQTESGTSGSDIVTFLTSKVGFCQQYAAAMAWMVRVAGIPARVAFGFTRGASPSEGTYIMTNRNLHAWTEVYFEGFGWVPFDATPASSVAGSARSAFAPDTDAVDPVSPSDDPSAAPDSGEAGAQNTPERPERDADLGAPGAAGGPAAGSSEWPWRTAGAGLLVLLLLTVPAIRRALLRRRRRHSVSGTPPVSGTAGPPGVAAGAAVLTGVAAVRAREDAHAAWDELLDTMIDFRLPVDPAETPRLTAARLTAGSQLTGTAAQGAALLGRAEERARYARDPMQEEQLGAALQQVRRALKAGAGRWVRFTAAVLPPSVLLRWRMGIGRTSSRVVTGVNRFAAVLSRFNVLARWNPRRLLAQRSGR